MRAKPTPMAEFEPAPSTPDTVFCTNPSQLLLEALGKTRAHLDWRDAKNFKLYKPVRDETGYYLLAIPWSEWPEGFQVHEYPATEFIHKRTVLSSEHVEEPDDDPVEPERKKRVKVVAKKVVMTPVAAGTT